MSALSSSRDLTLAIGASAVAGAALWATRASIDFVGTAQATERVAMLPPWSELAGCVALCVLVSAAIAALLNRKSSEAERGRFWSPAASDTLLPLFGLVFLVLPYFPYVADWIPILRVFGGPSRYLVWGVVLGQVFWVLVSRLTSGRRIGERTAGRVTIAAALATISIGFSISALPRLMASEHFAASPAAPAGGAGALFWTSVTLGAATVAVLWLWTRAASASTSAATAACVGLCLSPPFALNTLGVMPEGLLAFALAAAAALSWRFQPRLSRAVLFSVALASGIIVWGILTRGDTAHFVPSAVPVGIAGLLFDQEYGLVAYSPAFLVATLALIGMLRSEPTRNTALQIVLIAAPFIFLAACLHPWWSKSAMPGRLLLPVFPTFALPLGWWYQRTIGRPKARAATQLVLLTGLVTAGLLIAAAEDMPLPQEADGSSSLLQWMSHGWWLPSAAPSFVVPPVRTAVLQTAVWLCGFCAFAWASGRDRHRSPGRAALEAGFYAATVALIAASLSTAVAQGSQKGFDPEARSVLPMLEGFDSTSRPIVVRYNPMSFVPPESLPGLFSLAAVPGLRQDPQARRVILNARFRLPAGEYLLEIGGAQLATLPNPEIGLQIGREGRPMVRWPIIISSRGSWQRRFSVPVDAQFVAFRASPPVAAAIASLKVVPINVYETRRRFATPLVLSAVSLPTADVLFHDRNSYAEAAGFWVRGRTTSRITVVKKNPASPSIAMLLHSGARPNIVIVSTGIWIEAIELVANVPRIVEIPSDATEQFMSVTIEAGDGFVPAEIQAGNRDDRLLGAWISFIPDETAKTF